MLGVSLHKDHIVIKASRMDPRRRPIPKTAGRSVAPSEYPPPGLKDMPNAARTGTPYFGS